MLEEIEASRAEAELRSGKSPLPELDGASEKPKRKPLPDGLATEELVYAAPCHCTTCGGTSFLEAADRVVQVLEHVPAWVKIVRHVEKRMLQGMRYDSGWRDADLADRARQTRARAARPYHDRQIRRSYSPLPPVLDVRPVQDRHLPIRDGRLGRPRIRFAAPLVLLIRAHIAALDRVHTDDTRSMFSTPGGVRQKLTGSGSTSLTAMAINPPVLQPSPITTAQTGRARIPVTISQASAASCMPTGMGATRSSTATRS